MNLEFPHYQDLGEVCAVLLRTDSQVEGWEQLSVMERIQAWKRESWASLRARPHSPCDFRKA
jgi:hypothetical protein